MIWVNNVKKNICVYKKMNLRIFGLKRKSIISEKLKKTGHTIHPNDNQIAYVYVVIFFTS